jgi:hypothetical protein
MYFNKSIEATKCNKKWWPRITTKEWQCALLQNNSWTWKLESENGNEPQHRSDDVHFLKTTMEFKKTLQPKIKKNQNIKQGWVPIHNNNKAHKYHASNFHKEP